MSAERLRRRPGSTVTIASMIQASRQRRSGRYRPNAASGRRRAIWARREPSRCRNLIMAYFVGLDVSLKMTSICIVEADGTVV